MTASECHGEPLVPATPSEPVSGRSDELSGSNAAVPAPLPPGGARPWSDPAADPLADTRAVARWAEAQRAGGPCGHCGLTSHGFVCCGALFADEPDGCSWPHDTETAKPPHRAPIRGQSGPARPPRAPRAINPRSSR